VCIAVPANTSCYNALVILVGCDVKFEALARETSDSASNAGQLLLTVLLSGIMETIA